MLTRHFPRDVLRPDVEANTDSALYRDSPPKHGFSFARRSPPSMGSETRSTAAGSRASSFGAMFSFRSESSSHAEALPQTNSSMTHASLLLPSQSSRTSKGTAYVKTASDMDVRVKGLLYPCCAHDISGDDYHCCGSRDPYHRSIAVQADVDADKRLRGAGEQTATDRGVSKMLADGKQRRLLLLLEATFSCDALECDGAAHLPCPFGRTTPGWFQQLQSDFSGCDKSEQTQECQRLCKDVTALKRKRGCASQLLEEIEGALAGIEQGLAAKGDRLAQLGRNGHPGCLAEYCSDVVMEIHDDVRVPTPRQVLRLKAEEAEVRLQDSDANLRSAQRESQALHTELQALRRETYVQAKAAREPQKLLESRELGRRRMVQRYAAAFGRSDLVIRRLIWIGWRQHILQKRATDRSLKQVALAFCGDLRRRTFGLCFSCWKVAYQDAKWGVIYRAKRKREALLERTARVFMDDNARAIAQMALLEWWKLRHFAQMERHSLDFRDAKNQLEQAQDEASKAREELSRLTEASDALDKPKSKKCCAVM